jgi:prephenate dehydrogenase
MSDKYHPYVMWRRVALWSNNSWWTRTVFWGGVMTAAWYSGVYMMDFTNRYTQDPEMLRELESSKTTEQQVQTDIARQQLQKLLDDIKSGEDQKRSWKPT